MDARSGGWPGDEFVQTPISPLTTEIVGGVAELRAAFAAELARLGA